ncbi:MAG TPA: hypothetical protein PKJ04_00935 [Nitrospira sp.]|nr:hypothetical protein [Nitrospira sp.]
MMGVRWRLIAVVAATVGAVVGALAFEALLSLDTVTPFGHTGYGHGVGWAGLAVTLLVFVYPFRKRARPTRRWPRAWFRVHMVAGVIGPLLIFIHSGAHYHAVVPILAMVSMVVVVVSGIVGQLVHAASLRTLNEQRHLLQHQGMSENDIDAQLHGMASQEEAFRLWQAIHAPMTLMFLVFTLLHVVGALFFAGIS